MIAIPIVSIALTVLVYACADELYHRSNRMPLLHPVITSMVTLIAILHVTHTSYAQYMAGGQYISFLLGPVTVALAVPLYRNVGRIRTCEAPVFVALVAGSVTAGISAVVISASLGLPSIIVRSLAAKSVTAPVAMTISEHIGGAPALTAAFAVCNGILGVIIAGAVFRGERHWRSRGLALGVTSHGLGTAYAFTVNDVAGAFSSLGMGLNAVLSAVWLPALAALVMHN